MTAVWGASTIGQRYGVEATLGEGGMAIVYQVLDTSTGERRALKRLRPPERADKRQLTTALFEREFLTLSQLLHPRVVAVYDYGIDADGPYYTMELLDGGDLQQLAPLDVRKACSIARDVCSALSLLHSRRMVYRDLSPRNVRCTSDGLAKLIDFGAMVPMGPSRQLIGTPAFCAPEALDRQPLDARTDLYALGATLYFTLVGRNPYPARDFVDLRKLWQARPRRPSELVPGVPDGLDRLVMDLIQLDPALRPARAAEVIERLSAIAGLPADEQLLVSQAYLSTPTLVGREPQLVRVRPKLARTLHGHGANVLIEGAGGVGRSRLLDACVLEAKLAGITTLRADSSDAQFGDYGVVRALCAQLLQLAPELALQAAEAKLALLGHVLPELREQRPEIVLETIAAGEQLGPRVQPLLQAWLLEISRQRPLLIAVDDLHRVDGPSAALLAALANHSDEQPLLLLATTERGAHSSAHAEAAIKLFADASTGVAVDPLGEGEAELLLESVFGDVPNIKVVAHRLYAITSGNPRDLMQLAHHLLDTGMIRYQAGAWSLPQAFDPADLPAGMAQARKAVADALEEDTKSLAQAIALSPEQHFAFDECALLCAEREPARTMHRLDALVGAGIVRFEGQGYSLTQHGWIPPLTADLGTERAQIFHSRLGELFRRRGDGFREAQHVLRAGEHERGLDALVAHARVSEEQTDQDPEVFNLLLRSLPRDWFASYQLGIRLCESLRRPRRDLHALLSRLAGLSAVTDVTDTSFFDPLLAQLQHECGLDLYAVLDPALEPMERLRQALTGAQQRYEQSSDMERVFDPLTAIRRLARAIIQAIGAITSSNDYEFWKRLPSLAPLTPLSPALAAVDQLVRGNGARTTGLPEQALQIYRTLLDRLAEPDRAGLDPSHHEHMSSAIMRGVGMAEACMGLSSSLAWADRVDAHAMYKVNALQIRRVYCLWQGDSKGAERCRRQAEVLRIQSGRQLFEGMHLMNEIGALALADDLTGVKQTAESIALQAERYAAWVPVLHYSRGEYHRLRGDLVSGLHEIEHALRLMEPAMHQLWSLIAGSHVRILFELGRCEDATEHGREYLRVADLRGLGYPRNYVRVPLAPALAALGRPDEAAAAAQAAIDDFLRLGTSGLNLATAYEARARVALLAGDYAAFDDHAASCDRHIHDDNAQLRARHERMVREARAAQSGSTAPPESRAATAEVSSGWSEVALALDACSSAAECARKSLELLMAHSASATGLLYGMAESGPTLAAQIGEIESGTQIDALAREYLIAETQDRNVTIPESKTVTASQTATDAPRPWDALSSRGERLHRVVLTHRTGAVVAITGLAVLLVSPGASFRYPAELATQISRMASRWCRAESRLRPMD